MDPYIYYEILQEYKAKKEKNITIPVKLVIYAPPWHFLTTCTCIFVHLILAHIPVVVNVRNMLCSAGNLFKDTVEPFFVQVYYKGGPGGVCPNEVVFKAFTVEDIVGKKRFLIRFMLSPEESR